MPTTEFGAEYKSCNALREGVPHSCFGALSRIADYKKHVQHQLYNLNVQNNVLPCSSATDLRDLLTKATA